MHILTNLDLQHFEVSAAALHKPTGTDMESQLAESGIPVQHLDKKLGFDPRMFWRINGVLKRLKPHVVHTHLSALRYSLPALLLRRPPVVVHTIHNVAQKEGTALMQKVHRLAYKTTVVPVAIAKKVEETFHQVYGPRDLPLIPNGIPIDKYKHPTVDQTIWRMQEGIGPEDILFVNVARAEPQKNQALLLSAFAQAFKQEPHAHLLNVGRPSMLGHKLAEQVQELGIAERVHFLGERFDIPDILHASDVFVLSSDWEGNPLVVMEAMSAGLPVISTAVGGVPELIQDQKTGLLVPPGDQEALSHAMTNLFTHAQRREAIGTQAAQHAALHFTVQAMANAYGDLYHKLLNRLA